jgi:hypothetical protein
VDQQLVLQLVRNHPKLALFSADGLSIITANERDALHGKLTSQLSSELVSKSDFIAQHDIHVKSLEVLLSNQEEELLNLNGCVGSESYERRISEAISALLNQALKDVQLVGLRNTHLHLKANAGIRAVIINSENLPGSPPLWFISHILSQVQASSKFSIKKTETCITVIPNGLLEASRDGIINDLETGTLAYLDLKEPTQGFSELFPSLQDALSYLHSFPGIDVIDKFAVSQAWRAKVEEDCIRILEQEGCSLDVGEVIGSRLPERLRSTVAATVEKLIIAAFSENPGGPQITRVGDFLLTDTRRDNAIDELSSYAQASATSQWESLKTDPSKPNDIKFSISSIELLIPQNHRVLHTLLLESSVKKVLDEAFSSTLNTLEAQNEHEFSDFWTARIFSRYHHYVSGLLTQNSDKKLWDQLADLFATYTYKDLLPDHLAKAKQQGLVLSRKSRKNVAKLEADLLGIEKGEVLGSEKGIKIPVLTRTIAQFMKRQSIPPPHPDTLAATKQSMLDDMRRDMQRRVEKGKTSDGPVLFLLLVIILFAKHYNGIVYATGKFAPKLLKYLKTDGKVGDDEHKKLEGWKEAAKTNTLSAEDREGMVKMAEA